MRTEFGPGRYGIPQHGKLKFGYFYRVSFENADRHGLAPQDLEQDLQTRLPHEWLESSILVTASYLSDEEWEAFTGKASGHPLCHMIHVGCGGRTSGNLGDFNEV
jgi:hypothetical protein